jgi:glutaredoxin
MASAVVFGDPACGRCRAAKSLLRNAGFAVDARPLEVADGDAVDALLADLPDVSAAHMPFVFVDGHFVGSLEETRALVAGTQRPDDDDDIDINNDDTDATDDVGVRVLARVAATGECGSRQLGWAARAEAASGSMWMSGALA